MRSAAPPDKGVVDGRPCSLDIVIAPSIVNLSEKYVHEQSRRSLARVRTQSPLADEGPVKTFKTRTRIILMNDHILICIRLDCGSRRNQHKMLFPMGSGAAQIASKFTPGI